jgi:LPXTG-site transpeptidase (sortase) family protein
MQKNTKLKLSVRIAIVCFIGIISVGCYFLFLPKTNSTHSFGWQFPVTKFPMTGSNQGSSANSKIRDPKAVPEGLPVRLKIPSLGVDSAIEDALITPDGRMDVPAGSVNVAWFALGPQPGDVGSAVIGGHYGIKDGVPFVFYKLNTIQVGDKIQIVNDKGDTINFVVRSTKSFDSKADATDVFTSSDGVAHLNLITCEGTWNQVNGGYPDRFVVFADKE